jgi:hydrogenase maturation protease
VNEARILVLGLGNELLADDAAGVLAARAVAETLRGAPVGQRATVDVVDSSLSGLALLELFVGHERAIVIDAVQTGRHPVGTVIDIDPRQLGRVIAPSPHYAGLPELFEVATRLGLEFPTETVIFAVEVADPHTIGGPLHPAVSAAVPQLAERCTALLDEWLAAVPSGRPAPGALRS